jgi:uncharacterized protein HemY
MNRSALEQLLSKGNDNAMLRYTLGLVCFKEKDHEAALGHLEQALAQDRNHSASWKLYGKALVAAGKSAEAIMAYQNGIAVAEAQGDIQAVKEMQVFLKRLIPLEV